MLDQIATAHSALFPEATERTKTSCALERMLADLDRRIAAGPVVPTTDMAAFGRELAGFDFSTPRVLDDVLRWSVNRLANGLVQITHPRYFGLFNPAPSFPAQCADRVVAAFNPQLATATTSPVAVAIEAHVIRAVAARAGLPAGAGGHFTTGGAEANRTALVCALTASHPDFATEGVRCFAGAPRLYISREAHLAWIKIAHETGHRARRGAPRPDRRAGADGCGAARGGDRGGPCGGRRSRDGGGDRRARRGPAWSIRCRRCAGVAEQMGSGSMSMRPGAAR